MAVLSIKTFGGLAPVMPARYLQDNQAQTALNCPMWNGSLQPLTDPGDTVLTLAKNIVPKTIYKFGQDTTAENNYWFHWASDVDVCRSQISGDASEWTFFTGDGGPKATYNAIALGSSGQYPTETRPLGLPAPTSAPSASADTFTPDQYSAEVTLFTSHLEALTSTYGLLISTSTDSAGDYTTVSIPTNNPTASQVVSAVNSALSSVTATNVSGGVKIATTATGPSAKLFVKYQTGNNVNTDGIFTYDSSPNLSANGTSDTDPFVVILDSEIGSITSGDKIFVSTENGTHVDDVAYTFSGSTSATLFAAFLNTQLGSNVTATVYGSCVVLTPDDYGSGASGVITYKRQVANEDDDYVTVLSESGSESAGPARVFLTQTHVDAAEDQFMSITVNGNENFLPVYDPAYVTQLTSLTSYGVSVQVFGSVEPFAVVKTNSTGTSAGLTIRTGDYPTTAVYSLQQAVGYEDEDDTLETRVYAYTYVNKESGFEFESAPSPASGGVDVRDGQTVSLSGFSQVPGGGYLVTNKRIYRSVNGIYLFVAEIGASDANFVDDVKPEVLGEELPTLTWAAPPQTLTGLINLPNGNMAGFSGRDVYFCDPYHPHAWPENYIQTVDYPVVGLGRMDTTLAVLTKGTPYFIQGTHPDSMAVVKSDIEQACVSKKSIVSLMGGVLYASPDGLMLLSPQGSRLVTEQLFDYTQWQAFFKPESIHAYQHDNQYIAFYDNGTTQGGFIFDVRSGNFILHDVYAETAYHDLQGDKLFIAQSNRAVKVWAAGDGKTYTWRSKKFSMPQIMGFACAQLEAESYPMTLKVYADGTQIHSQTVQSRAPFRLPAKVGRDWEFQIEGDYEVFSVSVANSMTEIASG